MAISSRSSTPTAKQTAAAERIEGFAAEQRRLKEAAAGRRAEAAERADAGFSAAAPASTPAPRRRNKYLS